MNNQAASTALLQSALQSAQELEDQLSIHALSVRMDAVAGRLVAAVMVAARNSTHVQYIRVREEAELVKPRLQQCLTVCPALYRSMEVSMHHHIWFICVCCCSTLWSMTYTSINQSWRTEHAGSCQVHV